MIRYYAFGLKSFYTVSYTLLLYRSKGTSCCPETKNVACSPIKQLNMQDENDNFSDYQNLEELSSESNLQENSSIDSSMSTFSASNSSNKSDPDYSPNSEEVSDEEVTLLDFEKIICIKK